MKFSRTVISAIVLCVISAVASARPTVGLVLSGGGAKGIAHVGVIKALEDNGVPIDYITGTSMGAIVGGLYACGYSPEQMMELFVSAQFLNASTGHIDPDRAYYFSRPPESPRMASFALSNDSIAKRVPQSLISPLTMDYEFMEIFSPYNAVCGGDFDRLMVPFRCVASNCEAKRPEVMRQGSVGAAIRASMTFPLVFSPIAINDTLMYDGGIYDNFPVDVMERDFHPDMMVGVDVHTPQPSPAPTALNQIDNLVTMPQSYDLPADRGVRIHINLTAFNLLDFPKARQIYDVGYRRGLEMVDSIKARCGATRDPAQVAARRAEFNSRLPRMRFGSVKVTGGSPAQNAYVEGLFGHPENGVYSMRSVRDGFYHAITTDAFANLYPVASYNRDSGLFDLSLRAYPKAAWRVGVGGYITSSTTSMLFADVDYNSLGNTPLDANLGGWLGQNYFAGRLMATLRLGPASRPYAMSGEAVVSRRRYNQTDQMFYQRVTPDFVDHLEAYGRLYFFSMALGRHAKGSVSGGYGYLRDRSYDASGVRHVSSQSLWQVALRYDYSTLNSKSYPTSGMGIHAAAMWMPGNYRIDYGARTNCRQLRVRGEFSSYFPLGKHFALGVNADVTLSNRKLVDDYYAAITSAETFTPTPSGDNSFNSAFRANSFVAVGIQPIWKIVSKLQLRGYADVFLPWRKIENVGGRAVYTGGCFNKPEFFGELAAVYDFPFAALSVYMNYHTGIDSGLHGGVTFGLYIPAPQFTR